MQRMTMFFDLCLEVLLACSHVRLLFLKQLCLRDVVINPIEVVKTRLQIQGELRAQMQLKYQGFLHGLIVIVKEEGFSGLYKG